MSVWGSPEQLKLMAALKAPDWGVAVMVILPDPPDAIDTEEGFVPRDTDASTVALPHVEVNFTGPEIRFSIDDLPTA